MSLINKMLQDLDARRSDVSGSDAYGSQIRAVPPARGIHAAWWVALGLAIVLAGLLAWLLLRPATPLETPVGVRPQLPLRFDADLNSAPPVASPAAEQAPLAEPPAASTNAGATATAIAPITATRGAESAAEVARRDDAQAAPQPAATLRQDNVAASAAARSTSANASVAPEAEKRMPPPKAEPQRENAQVAPGPADSARNTAEAGEIVAKPSAPVLGGKRIKEPTPQQRAENEFRQAAGMLRQGRTAEAIDGLEQALQLDPRHAAARQTLIGALLEAGRRDEAMREAREGLALDLAQPGLAMILARLQLDQSEQPGGVRAAIATLEATAPHASDRADYQAFLAALLQRDARHKEAIHQYLLALNKAPQNGVWWMGLGISLQADGRLSEAQEAFTRAKSSGSLSAELLAFVESKLKQSQR